MKGGGLGVVFSTARDAVILGRADDKPRAFQSAWLCFLRRGNLVNLAESSHYVAVTKKQKQFAVSLWITVATTPVASPRAGKIPESAENIEW